MGSCAVRCLWQIPARCYSCLNEGVGEHAVLGIIVGTVCYSVCVMIHERGRARTGFGFSRTLPRFLPFLYYLVCSRSTVYSFTSSLFHSLFSQSSLLLSIFIFTIPKYIRIPLIFLLSFPALSWTVRISAAVCCYHHCVFTPYFIVLLSLSLFAQLHHRHHRHRLHFHITCNRIRCLFWDFFFFCLAQLRS